MLMNTGPNPQLVWTQLWYKSSSEVVVLAKFCLNVSNEKKFLEPNVLFRVVSGLNSQIRY